MLQFTGGAYLHEMGYSENSSKKQGIYRPASLKKRRLMSALGASPNLNESVLKQAISVERSLKVASCDFALDSTQAATTLDPYKNLPMSNTTMS
jgi:hypothetical protein